MVSSLERRLASVAKELEKRSLKSAIGKLPEPQPKQKLFLDCEASIVFFGGSAGGGKSLALLLDSAKPEYLSNPKYNSVIFRKTYPELNNPGGLVSESQELYYKLGSKFSANSMDWRFPSGARISFRHLQHEKTVYQYQGSQFGRLNFDELSHFSEASFFYLLSRLRSTSGIEPKVRATMNPDFDSWIREFIGWWIDPDSGYIIPERSGVIRYFVRVGEKTHWADTEQGLLDLFPSARPKSFTFIASNIFDNQELITKDPNYLSNLENLHPVERERLLKGNWLITYAAGVIFDRTWFEVIEEGEVPDEFGSLVRFWDMAATAREVAKDTSFFTASLKMKKIGDVYYMLDVMAEQIKGGKVETHIKYIASLDGIDCAIRWEKEGGSAGVILAETLTEEFLAINPKFDAKAVKPLGDKVTRALAPATAASLGKVKLVRGEWNLRFLNACQSFDGTRKPMVNDIVDAFSGAFKELESLIVVPDYANYFATKKSNLRR